MIKEFIDIAQKVIPRPVKTCLRPLIPKQLLEFPYQETSININHERKIVFVHNPKCAGNTIKKILGFPTDYSEHYLPVNFLTKKTWENYFTFAFIRHPLDRLISSFFFHTSPQYQGHYFKRVPNLKTLSLEEYFEKMTQEPYAIVPNALYTQHPNSSSKRKVDFLGRYETLEKDLQKLCDLLTIPYQPFHENKSRHDPYESYFDANPNFRKKCMKYYSIDTKLFGYD